MAAANKSAGANRRNSEMTGSPINYVQMEGLAVMKIIKHCHEDGNVSGSASDVAQGALLGLVVDDRLEITNCFPFPRIIDESMDEDEYQLAMMRRLRMVNVDHFHVGWYQSAEVGSFLTCQLVESQYGYQTSIEESVVVVYDPQKTSRGFLSLQAFRLSPQGVAMYAEQDFTPEAMRRAGVGFESLFEEVPLVINNSPLVQTALAHITDVIPDKTASHFLDLGTAPVLESHLRLLMDRVDELNSEAAKFNRHQHLQLKQLQERHKWMQKRAAENSARQARGEPPLPEDDASSKSFRPLPAPPRLQATVYAGQVASACDHLTQYCGQALAKLFVTEAVNRASYDAGAGPTPPSSTSSSSQN